VLTPQLHGAVVQVPRVRYTGDGSVGGHHPFGITRPVLGLLEAPDRLGANAQHVGDRLRVLPGGFACFDGGCRQPEQERLAGGA
jgi:hypothetical protein